jgi:hypothetical protein
MIAPLALYGWLWLVYLKHVQLLHLLGCNAIVAHNFFMDIRDRLNKLIDHKGITPTELVEKTGIDRMKWANLKRLRVRAQQEHIEAIVDLWPEYAYWITTGKTLPEAGQISPELEETRKNLSTGT